MHFTYILYSKILDKYYVGACSGDLNTRLKEHLWKHKGFTAKAKDWVIVFSEKYPTKKDAFLREKQIKKWKLRKMIEALIKSGN